MDYAPAYSPDGARIAFTSNRSGSREIWVCNRDGSGLRKLTSMGGTGHTADPQWSPNGRVILFHSQATGQRTSYLIDANGGNPTPLCPDCIASSFSHDGHWMYYDAQEQVWKMPWPPSGQAGKPVPVTRHGGSNGHESPDGKMLYYGKASDDECGTPLESSGRWRRRNASAPFVLLAEFVVVERGDLFHTGLAPGEYAVDSVLRLCNGRKETVASLSDEAA